MPRKSVRTRRRERGCLSRAIALLVVAAVALTAAIVISERRQARQSAVTAQNPSSDQYVDVAALPGDQRQLVLKASDVQGEDDDLLPVDAAALASPTPTPEPTPEPTFNPADPYALVRPQAESEDMLPVFKRANTDQLRIAITLDECADAEVLEDIARMATRYGAKLTLFPCGENLLKKGMSEVIKGCYRLGFEIENRCYTTSTRLYRLTDGMMTGEIWKQSVALNYALGFRYQPHFLRLYGGNGESDRRTHAYLMQQGYLGIANWSVAAANVEADRIADTLTPGYIYQFKPDRADVRKMELLMQEAQRQGYAMVTLNELFGYPANEVQEVRSGSILTETMPELKDYDGAYYYMKIGDCTWATYLMQRRLEALGYLSENSADGIYGASTAAALSAFQARCGIAATGSADVQTQELLFAPDAPAINGGGGEENP